MPSRCVVDTDVLAFYLRSDARADLYDPHLAGASAFISFMTVAELERWVLARDWSSRRRVQLDDYLAQFTVVPIDRPLCRLWAEASHRASRAGRPLQAADAWVAATALLLGVPLVTHHRAGYIGIAGLTVISEGAP